MLINRRTLLLAASIPILSSACCLPVQAHTLNITDAIGRQVNVGHPVSRVIVTFNYEEFTAIAGVEGWKKVVGISRTPWEGWRPAIFSRYAKVIPNLQAMPDVGDIDNNTFSAEKVIALRPDVVFMAEWGFKAAQTQVEQITAAGIPIIVIDYNAQVLERHLASTRAYGKVMQAEQRAEELSSLYERQYRDILDRISRVQGAKPKVYVELGQAGPETIGNSYNDTMWGRIITLLGASNIAAGKIPGAWGPLNPEAVLAENPDVILIAGSSWLNRPKAVRTGYDADEATTRASLAPYAARPGWSEINAIKTGNINAVEHGLARTLFDFTAMQFIAKRLYPQAFADIDPVQSLRDYHERFLPVPFAGTWMLPLTP